MNHPESDEITTLFETGLGTTPGMWEMLSDILAEDWVKLPESLNNAIYALADGQAQITPQRSSPQDTQKGDQIMPTTRKEYLGDSVYANFNGYMITLTTENGSGPSNTIHLESGVFQALMQYAKSTQEVLQDDPKQT